jgi:hypothetical protein
MTKLEVLLVFLMVVALARFLMWHWCAWKYALLLYMAQNFAAEWPVAHSEVAEFVAQPKVTVRRRDGEASDA